MNVLIFGGAGFIGTNISLEAVKRGHKVIVFDSLIRKDTEENLAILKDKVEFIRGDVRNKEDFKRIPYDVDGIINLAANPGIPWSISWPVYDFETNALGALHVLEYSRHNGKIPVIFASTNKVYSDEVNEMSYKETETRYIWLDKKYKGIPESFPVDTYGRYPHSPYGCSKVAADLYHQEYWHVYQVPTVINRMSCIYGYYQKGVEDQGWAWHFVNIINQSGRLNIYGTGKQVRDMLWGGDVARLYLDELENIEKCQGQVFNVGGGIDNTLSLVEAITYLKSLTGNKVNLWMFPKRVADQDIYISDISKVTKALDWKPAIDPQTGLGMILDSLRTTCV